MATSSNFTPDSVRSKDGTAIAFEQGGRGPAVVFVHGSFAAGRTWEPIASALMQDCTCYVMDRRGRGRSGDHAAYAVEREYEDVEAVLDVAGRGASLVGHSFGAICALGAALHRPVRRLVLYEPPLTPATAAMTDTRFPPEFAAAVDSGDAEAVASVFLRQVAGVPEQQVRAMRSATVWEAIVRMAPSMLREAEVARSLGLDPERYATVNVPVLLLTGSETSASYREVIHALGGLLPQARTEVLEGHGHIGISTAPLLVAEHIRAFLRTA